MSTTESRAAANLAVVGGIYEAFGRGDIDFILDQIAEDCAWESWLDNHGQQAGIPPMKPRQGRAGVAEFFAYVGTMQIQGGRRQRYRRGAASVLAQRRGQGQPHAPLCRHRQAGQGIRPRVTAARSIMDHGP